MYFIRLFSSARSTLENYSSPTIYALSTAPGKAAIGVIRISGPASTKIYKQLTRSTKLPQPRKATVRKLYDPISQDKKKLLDEALCLYFKSPHSYTGEDSLELQVHGGRAVISSVMNALSELHTDQMPIRYAERGEFSQRGFRNGRFDFTEAEGINELVNAETEVQRISALSCMKGDTRKLFHGWRQTILNNVALLTTVIDFGEDHEIEEVNTLFDKVKKNIDELSKQVEHYLEKTKRSQILMDGIKMTLSGPPNAGKSSLLNVLADEDKAIVSSIAGTTRDAIEVPLAINGYKVIVGDTAGLRHAKNDIEREGIRRARQRSEIADLNLVMIPADLEGELDKVFSDHIDSIKNHHKGQLLIIVNKCDLIPTEQSRKALLDKLSSKFGIDSNMFMFISCKTKEGIPELNQLLTNKFQKITWTDRAEDPVTISKRARDILENSVLKGLNDFKEFSKNNDIVLSTESLRFSMDGIGKITGETIGVEEILKTVFSKFCIGK